MSFRLNRMNEHALKVEYGTCVRGFCFFLVMIGYRFELDLNE
jgi:hypothetical protein